MSVTTTRTLRITGVCLALSCFLCTAAPALASPPAPCTASATPCSGDNLNWD